MEIKEIRPGLMRLSDECTREDLRHSIQIDAPCIVFCRGID